MSWYDTILFPFKWLISWILVWIHSGLTAIGLPSGPSVTWILAIVVLTILVRVAIIPLYLKQIRSSRGMAVLTPEMTKIREKYKGRTDQVSRQQMSQETMALYKEYGVNPMASCFPVLIQLPVLTGMYRLLWQVEQIAAGKADAIGGMTKELANDMASSTLFGVHTSDTFATPGTHVKVFVVVAVVIYVGLMFGQQLLMVKWNMAPGNEQQERMMKMMLWLFPVMSLSFGFIVQMGLLVYLVVTMVFGFSQQVFVLYKLPTPNSKAHAAMMRRNQAKFDVFKEEENKSFEQALRSIGSTTNDVNQVLKIVAKNRGRLDNEGNPINPFTTMEQGERLQKTLELHVAHQEKLTKKAQDLELEERPRKKEKSAKTASGKAPASVVEQLLAPQTSETGRNQRQQPKRTTRAQRDAQSKQKRKQQQSSLSAQDREARRKARREDKRKK